MKYLKKFIFLKQDLLGYGFKGKDPSGRVMIEASGENAKIIVSVQNLKPENLYKAFLIKSGDSISLGAFIASICPDAHGRAEARALTLANNLFDSEMSIVEIDAVAIMLSGGEASAGASIWPLSGYFGDTVRWKNNFINCESADIKDRMIEAVSALVEDIEPDLELESVEIIESARIEVQEAEIQEVEVQEIEVQEVEAQEVEVQKVEAQEIEVQEVETQEIPFQATQTNPVEESIFETMAQEEAKEEIDDIQQEVFEEIEDEAIVEAFLEEAKEIFAEEVYEEIKVELNEAEILTKEEIEEEFEEAIDEEFEEIEESLGVKSLAELFNESFADFTKPFQKQNKEVNWIEIGEAELSFLGEEFGKIIANTFVLACLNRYGFLLLGQVVGSEEYYLGVPDIYNSDFKLTAQRLGFTQFKPSKDAPLKTGDFGYWLMSITIIR